MEKGTSNSKILSDHCGMDLMQAQQPAANEIPAYRRGDIPIFHDCDDRGDSLIFLKKFLFTSSFFRWSSCQNVERFNRTYKTTSAGY